jgi:hypothetical protein
MTHANHPGPAGADWPERCRPHDRRKFARPSGDAGGFGNPAQPPEVISLYQAAKRLGLRDRSKGNYTPLLANLAAREGCEIRRVPGDAPCMRAADLPRLGRALAAWLGRPRMWPRKPRRAGAVIGVENTGARS